MKKQRFSVLDAVASHLGMDRDDVREYRYHPTRTPCAVYSDPRGGEDCFTATNPPRKPKGCDNLYMGTWKWREVEAKGYAGAMGWCIWVAERES
jgi:hypothetical protein